MLNKTLFILFGFLAFASALNPILTKNFFFVNRNSDLSQQLFQTKNGIVGYTLETLKTGAFPQYLKFDIKSRVVTPILDGLVNSCGQGPSIFERLHYHASSQSLVYYCSNNHSLLILNEATYAVQTSIPTGITSKSFTEAKIVTEGDGVAILLMGSLFTTSPVASQLVKVNLSTKKLTLNVLLKEELGIKESVVGYAGNGNTSYVVTNRIEGNKVVTSLYTIIFNGTEYDLDPIVSLSEPLYPMEIITEIFLAGKRIIINSGKTVHFFDINGDSIKVEGVSYRQVAGKYPQARLEITSRPGTDIIYIKHGSDRFYNYTVEGTVVHFEQIGVGGELHIAHGFQNNGDLLFALNGVETIFTITDLKTKEVLYTSIAAVTDLDNIMITNSTYAVIEETTTLTDFSLYIFDLKTDALKAKIPIFQTYHFNKEQGIISYINRTGESNCLITHIDLATGRIFTTWSFNITYICDSRISDLYFINPSKPHMIVPRIMSGDYVIVIPESGPLVFTPPHSPLFIDVHNLIVNFTTMSLYYFDGIPTTQNTSVYYYEFNEVNKFQLIDSFNITKVPFLLYYTSASKKSAVFLAASSFAVFDIAKETIKQVNFNAGWNKFSSFQDGSGNDYLLLSKRTLPYFRNEAPGLYGPSGLTSVPYASNYTMRVGVANKCSYWVLDSYVTSVSMVRFYDVCGKSSIESISL